MARENSGWGYDRIVGGLANLGHQISDETVGNILRRHGIAPAPERSRTTSCRHHRRHTQRTGLVGEDASGALDSGHGGDLGRICVAGNSGIHTVKFVTASNGTDVPGGSLSMNMSGCTAGQFVYGTLTSPITLQANTAYFLATQEVSGGDLWYDYGTVTSTSVGNLLLHLDSERGFRKILI
jgi:hypothetical protein